MGAEVLSPRALNRALLARQLLLSRVELPAIEAVEHLVGLQAQVPANPYTALWSRLDGFQAEELSRALEERRVVRISVMRATIHLVSAADCLLCARSPSRCSTRSWGGIRSSGRCCAESTSRPCSSSRGGSWTRGRCPWRSCEQRSACGFRDRRRRTRVRLPVQARPRAGAAARRLGTICAAGVRRCGVVARPATCQAAVAGRGRPADLRAFGPATAADVATWSRLTGLAAVLERLRPRLVTFRDERGRELFDLPDAPRPDESVPAPARFLPEYDNVLLSHAYRTRIVPAGIRECLGGRIEGLGHGSVLVDGFLAGMWRPEGKELVVRLGVRLSKRSAASVAAEGRRLLRFLGDQTDAEDVRLVGPE